MKIFIGHDSREPELTEICRFSILKYASSEVEIHVLDKQQLADELSREPTTPQQSGIEEAEHLYTRFLIPHLVGFRKEWALYVDSDFIFLDDVYKLLNFASNKYAVMVAKHDEDKLKPYKEKNKLNGRPILEYPRKYWTSLMLFNCNHADSRKLNPKFIQEASGFDLLKLSHIPNRSIGDLPVEWNWLVGLYEESAYFKPRALHFAMGGPWFPAGKKVEYGALWSDMYVEYHDSKIDNEIIEPEVLQQESLPQEIFEIYEKIKQYRVDPQGLYYGITKKTLTKEIAKLDNNAVYAVEAETMSEVNSKHEQKGHLYDPFLQSFILGSGGQITVWDKVLKEKTPVVLRGVTKRKQMADCIKNNRDYYYIDTGYFGNGRRKLYHRITKNNMQNLGPVIHRPRDRLAATGWKAKKMRPGGKILLAPPSQKLLKIYNLDLASWIKNTLAELANYTDREVVIREKQSRSVRVAQDTMEMALDKDIHCLVTFSSIAAVEAVLYGKPAIVLGPSAAHAVCSETLEDIETPFIPTLDEVEEWAAHLAYCQFTELEMRDGTAWRILNEDV